MLEHEYLLECVNKHYRVQLEAPILNQLINLKSGLIELRQDLNLGPLDHEPFTLPSELSCFGKLEGYLNE